MGICGFAGSLIFCSIAVNKIILSCGVAVISNRTVCGVSRFKPKVLTVKRNNLRTLCGVVVYYLTVLTY